jgi:hypothetical protein
MVALAWSSRVVPRARKAAGRHTLCWQWVPRPSRAPDNGIALAGQGVRPGEVVDEAFQSKHRPGSHQLKAGGDTPPSPRLYLTQPHGREYLWRPTAGPMSRHLFDGFPDNKDHALTHPQVGLNILIFGRSISTVSLPPSTDALMNGDQVDICASRPAGQSRRGEGHRERRPDTDTAGPDSLVRPLALLRWSYLTSRRGWLRLRK